MTTIGSYAKAVNATLILTLGAVMTGLADGDGLGTVEIAMVITAFVGSLVGVLAVPMTPRVLRTYGKLAVTAIVAATTQFVTAYQDGGGVTPSEWVLIVITFLSGLGSVAATSNAAYSDAVTRPTAPRHARADI